MSDTDRVAALRDLEILDTKPEAGFDEIAFLAAALCGAPMACISFLDRNREWFKATVGFELSDLPLHSSFAYRVLDIRDSTTIDAAELERSAATHPLVASGEARFAAAVPVVTPEGIAVGALSVMSPEPFSLTEAQWRGLDVLRDQVMDRVQLRRSNLLLSQLEREDALRSLYELTADAGLGLPEQLNRLLSFGCQLFEMDAGLVGHMTETGYEIDEIYGPESFPLRRGQFLNVEDTFCAEVIRSGQPAAVPDVRGTPFAERRAHQEFGLLSYLGAPLIVDGQVYGCINFFGSEPHTRGFGSLDIAMQNVMANWVSGRLARVRAEQQRDAAYQARADFLARMSHEIRTPLHGVIGMVELLRATPLDEEQSGLTNTLNVSAHALLDVINDVLDFSKLEAGKLSLEAARVDIEEVVREVIEVIGPTATAKGIALRHSREPGLPVAFSGDRTRIRQVLMNLVGNGIKYTAAGEVVVEIGRPDGTQSGVELRVRDTGIGIDPSRLAAIFEPFEQAESSTTRRFGGTGLGLSISSSLVKLMGGAIEVESEPGHGSVFRVALPLDAWHEESPPTPATTTASPSSLAIGRVLIVDDNETNRAIAARMLARLGVASDAAPDGESGVRAAAEHAYDLILMDISMPVMDGFEALRRIRERSASPPILAMTASVTPEEREGCLHAGFDDILPKPFTLAQLTDTLARHSNDTTAPADLDGGSIDFERLDALLELDEPGEQSLLELFAAEARTRLGALRDAAEGADSEQSRQAAHSLKGLSASVGAAALAARAAGLEQGSSAGRPASLSDVASLEDDYERFLMAARSRRR